MNKKLTFEEVKETALREPETRKEYEALADRWDLRRKMIKLRGDKEWSPAQLASLMDVPEEDVTRIENSDDYPTLAEIITYARALGYKMRIGFEPTSPLDVPGIKTKATTSDILDAVASSRSRDR